jgi:hypothetical protein
MAAGAMTVPILFLAAIQLVDNQRGTDGIAARSGRERAEGGGAMANIVETKAADACLEPDDSSYGTTAMGEWLERLLLGVGMPQKPSVAEGDVMDTGTALQVSVYGGRMTAYVTASKPPDPEFAPDEAEVVGQEGAFLIYYREGSAWKSFTAVSPEWQLSLVLFPGMGHSSVSWDKGDRAVAEWFERAIARAGEDPPPCS